ncbi:MAG: hypothetical protein LBG11_11150 [Bifidobacteriaceae bacterium]|jgi:hypothetical protein|nr:hypothetical protein [Bifidobacteriaceae bacterium]
MNSGCRPACLGASIDHRIAELIAAVPPDQRNWERILSALGYDPTSRGALRQRHQPTCRGRVEASALREAVARRTAHSQANRRQRGRQGVPI